MSDRSKYADSTPRDGQQKVEPVTAQLGVEQMQSYVSGQPYERVWLAMVAVFWKPVMPANASCFCMESLQSLCRKRH